MPDTENDGYTHPRLERSALLVIDMQNDFVLDGAPASVGGSMQIVPNIFRLLSRYRSAGLPIIHVVRLYLANGSNADLCRRRRIEEGWAVVVPGSSGSEIVGDLKPDASMRLDAELLLEGGFQRIAEKEHVMYKPRWGAFYGTDLDGFLKQLSVNTLVFCGCNYPNCPRSGIYQASERDYRAVIASDALSRLTKKDEDELKGIGVTVTTTAGLEKKLDTFAERLGRS
jgi:nicotinamidase-related amidase